MFNYTKEVIINDPSVIVKGSASNGLGEGVVAVKRGGNYVIDNIEGKIFKTEGSKGIKAKVAITPAALESADVARLTIYLSTPGTEFVEFGSPNWQEFGKPYIIETTATTPEKLVEAIKLALNEDNAHFSVKVNETKVELEAAETWMDFAEVNYDLVTFADCSDCSKETVVSKTATNVGEITHGKSEFGTAKWIVENLRFPSHPNLRYAPLYADEAPVAGTVYTEYSFEYRVKRSVPGGLSAVGQVADSIVRIVFYVAPGAQTTFESAFGVGLIDITAATPTTDGK